MTPANTEEIIDDAEPENILPPLVINNPRQLIEAEQVSLTNLLSTSKKKRRSILKKGPLVKPDQPEPRFPLELSCSPMLLYFKLDQETVTQNLRLWNICKQSIYLLCCGMWDDTARLGASWYCHPRTRFWLPSGFMAKITVRAIPRGHAPIPYATSALQIAVGHKNDNVVGYIVVPVCANFLSYRPPSFGEGG